MPTTDALEDTPGQTAVGSRVSTLSAPGNRLIEWIGREKAAAMGHVEAWRKEAERCYRFRDGKQLDPADAAALKAQGRPDNVFNTAQKFIRFVTGVEQHTPEALIFEPIDETESGQQTLAEVMTRYYDWAIAKTFGDFERSRAFDDLIVTGMGWTDSFVDRSIDPKGLIKINRIPGKEMIWPHSCDQNLSSTRWRARETLVDREEATALWPDQEMLIRYTAAAGAYAGSPRPEAERPVEYTIRELHTKPFGAEGAGEQFDKVRILEWQWYDNLTGYYFFDPLEKEDVWYDDKKFEQYVRNLRAVTGGDSNYRIKDYIRQSQKVFRKAFILNDRWQLGEEMELPGKRFTFNCMTGYYDDENKVFYSYMRILIDPQRFGNKFFNQVIEIMGTQAKGGVIAEEGAIPPNKVKEFENKYAIPGSVNEVAANAISLNQIKFKPLPELPAATISLVDFCMKNMENVTGIDPETAFGQGATNTPGITLKQKQKSGLLLLNQEFSSLSRFRIDEGYIIFDLLKTLADDRLIRVGRPYDGAVLKLMRQPFAAEYDLMLDDTERDPNIRHLYAEQVMAMAPTLIRMNKFFPELLDYFPLPVKIRQILKKAISDTAMMEQKMAEQGVASHGRGSPVSPEERAAKVEKIKADALASVAKAERLKSQMERDHQRASLDEVKALLNVLVESSKLRMERDRQGAELAQKAVEAHLERKRIDVDMAKNQMQMAMHREAMQHKKKESE